MEQDSSYGMEQHGSSPNTLTKFLWSFPWLVRYPAWRVKEIARRISRPESKTHVIVMVANHYEPGLGERAVRRVEDWWEQARELGNVVRDHDGTPFRHTNFYPAEQYDHQLLELLAGMQREGLGEVEVHMHHGVDQPDTAENTRRMLMSFRNVLVDEHRCLSRDKTGAARYAFVHGNWALANSAGGRFCGVDNEMEILAETGCYADFTLPSAPDESQVARINSIYQCGRPMHERKPHNEGPDLKVGDNPKLPILVEGPLVFDWRSRRKAGIPVPRVDDAAMAGNYPLSVDRFNRWRSANITVRGRPDWVFVKLYCHGFFAWDRDMMIGEPVKVFWSEVMELAERTGQFKLHFASAREVFNMIMAAVENQSGDPALYRDYSLVQVMDENLRSKVSQPRSESELVV